MTTFKSKKIVLILKGLFFAFAFFVNTGEMKAAVLLPGNISTCGELAVPGTYTLTQNITGDADTCFLVSSDNVTIEGGGFTVTGSAATAIDGRAYTSGVLTVGAHGYTNLIINDITLSGYGTGINLSGNADTTGTGVNNGYGGDAGDVAIFYSYVGGVTLHGGNSSSKNYGGLGGNIAFTDTDLNISNSTISALGGVGTTGRNTNGGLDVTYSGTLNKTNTTLSALSFLNENATSYGVYPGGTFPFVPGNIDSCGTLIGSGTYTLTQDVMSSSTCFIIGSNNIVIDGNGHSISAATTTSAFAVSATTYSGFTLASTTVNTFTNLITSSSSVTISGHNLDLSNKFIAAGSLTLSYTGTLNKVGATVSALSGLTVNTVSQGTQNAGPLLDWMLRDASRFWFSVASSADGTKLAAVVQGGQIYTSTDSGTTWTARDSNRTWYSIASSADGTKLAAAVYSGQIYTSTDSGVTWTARNSSRNWNSITSSADGTKLAAVHRGGQIYTSTDSGVTWTARDSNRSWYSIASSADGTKLAAVVNNSQIYTSTDSGATWTARESSRQWVAVASSADGTKLAAVAYGGQIYTSTDSGVTWTARDSNRSWNSITSSADGTKLSGVVYGGRIYTSSDSGVTWTARDSNRSWYSIASSADGTKLVAGGQSTQIYTHSDDFPTLKVDILTPQSSTYTSWSPIVSWGSATSCYYSFDNFVSTSTANCASGGSDISNPGLGSHTLYVKGIDANGVVVQKNVAFMFGLPITITAPTSGSTVTSWNPVINWDPNSAGNLTNCYYSYNNFVSTSTASCSGTGGEILAPTQSGTTTLSLRTVNSSGQVGINSVTFVYSTGIVITWTARDSARNWYSITSSADGTKLAAIAYNGQIYTSTDSGATWTARDSSRTWFSVTSSSDGTKLTASVNGGQIYTSADSGATWTARDSNRAWRGVASSGDGTKLAATVSNGQIYTSIDSGATWTARDSNRQWYSIASSADGTKLAAVVQNGQIYTSTDSGVTWTARDSSRLWYSIASSADGTKLAATAYNGQIYTSIDSGVTWAGQASGSRSWYSVASSADGTRLAAVVLNGQIYTSTDSGGTWLAGDSNRQWYSIASSADGTKLAAAVSGGQIYTYNSNPQAITITRPHLSQSVLARAWSSLVNWGSSVACYYSYNNWVSSSTVSCANNGTDIAYPSTRGSNTLYVRGVDGTGATTSQSVAFDFDPLVRIWTARDSNRSWNAITISNDGTKLAAVVYGGQIYTSTDSGATWTAQSSGSRSWRGIASSADGTKLVAYVQNGQIYTSTNSGATWTARESNRVWNGIASSADGTKLAATVYSGQIYTSTDSGATWTARDSSRLWYSVASSADGTKLAAIVGGGQIYTSTNSGATWTAQSSGSRSWRGIASSADGTKLAAVVQSGQIYTSTDSGATWTARESSRQWVTVASSADGVTLVATGASMNVYMSTDSGATWTALDSSRSWIGVASSADGAKLAAVVNGGQIYTSSASIEILSPTASSTISSWSPSVNWANSVTCQYSYDNSTWSNASCAGTGSEISASSTSGLKTLYIKGTDFLSVVSTSSVSFTYSPIISGNSLSSCGTISSSGTYTLTQDITNVSGTCFVVAANDVTINGAGHTVTAAGGNTSYAVSIRGVSFIYSNPQLQDIHFSGFGSGIVDSSSALTYSGTDIDLSNSTTTASALTINFTNSLTIAATYFSNLSNLIINSIDLGEFSAGLFSFNTQDISSCQTISSAGYYKLTQDITGIAGTCFTITANKVIVDGDGHTITSANGNTSYAFDATQANGDAYTNIGIKNLTVVGFAGGVDARGADGIMSNNAGKNGGRVSLHTVTFPTDIAAANTSGGDGFYESTTVVGGNAGHVKVTDSIIGPVILNGGDATGDMNIGSDNGTQAGGSAGTVTNVNSTIGAVTAIEGAGYIPGCMDDSFDSYNPAATYSDGTCTNLDIGTGRDNPLGNTVSGPISFLTGFANYGIVDGDASYYVTTNNGTTTGYADFYNGSNFGYVGGGALFDDSYNYGVVDGDVTFQMNFSPVGNEGTINGNVFFYSTGASNAGIINGNADFSYGNFNDGTVNGDAIFAHAGDNRGTVTGTITYAFGCADVNALNYSGALNDDGSCQYYGTHADNPQGNTITTGTIEFFVHSNYGTIDGNASFVERDQSYNNYGPSYNYGTTTGNAYFEGQGYDSGNYGYVGGNATFNGSHNRGIVDGDASFMYANNDGTVNGNTIFMGYNYYNNGTINGNVDFTDNGSGQSYNTGIVTGDALFYNAGDNMGTVTGTVTYLYGCTDPSAANYVDAVNNDGNCVYYGSNMDLPSGTLFTGDVIFQNGYSNYGTVDGNATVYVSQNSANYGTTTGNVIFDGYYTGVNHDSADNTLYVDGSVNYFGTGAVGGIVYDTNATLITDFDFSNANHNFFVLQGNAIFHDDASNQNRIIGNAVFNDNSYNAFEITGDATFNTTYYASTTPSGGVMSFETNHYWIGSVGGQVLGSDSNPITTYVFYGNTRNIGTIVGDAIFYDNSYNQGTVIGNVTYMNASGGTHTLTGNQQWWGTVTGTIKGADDTVITSLVFNDSSSNYTTIASGTSVVFNDTASNHGTINGDATFNGTTFRIGTVNGTATLGGVAQTLQGVSYIVNFFKHALSRDTLYIQQDATLYVTGLTTILGADGENLLTLRSTTPGSYAALNITGTSNMNNLRIKDIRNTGLSQDVSTKTIFDDGHNQGFTFPSNSTPSSRGAVTSTYTPPVIPPSRLPSVSTPTPTTNNTPTPARAAQSGTIDSFFTKTIAPIVFKDTTRFGVVNDAGKNAGTTYIPNPLKGLKTQDVIKFVTLPTNFLNSVSKFLFGPSANNFKNYPELTSYLASKGISIDKPQDIVTLGNKPIQINATDEIDVPGVYSLNVASDITYNKSNGSIIQLVKTQGGKKLNVSLISDQKVTGTYAGQNITFNSNGNFQTVDIVTPTKPGTYTVKSSASPISLVIQVVEAPKTTPIKEIKKNGIINWIKNLFN